MSTTNDLNSLFNFFKILDDSEALADLVKSLVIEACDEFQSLITNYNFQTGLVETEVYDAEKSTAVRGVYNANDEVLIRITKVTRDIINMIDLALKHALEEGKEQETYLKNYDNILIALSSRKYLGFKRKDLLHVAFADISHHMKVNYNYLSSFNFFDKHKNENSEYLHPLSYRWKYSDSESGLLNLKKLFKLLTMEPVIISCSEKDFLNAFTQSRIDNGIKWCVMGKNGQYSKQALLTFVDYLMANNYIQEKTIDFNQSIIYVFRDNKGNQIKNISTSKSSSTKIPSEWNRILQILNQI